jgi:hypothetical protein
MGTKKEQGNTRSINTSRKAILKGIRRRPYGSGNWTRELRKIVNIQPLRNGSPIYVFRRQKP